MDFGAVEDLARIGAPRVMQIFHFARVAAVEPFWQAAQFRKIFRGDRRYAAEIEAESASAFGDP